MNNLMRAVRMALKYKYSLLASLLCSVLVAVFWAQISPRSTRL